MPDPAGGRDAGSDTPGLPLRDSDGACALVELPDTPDDCVALGDQAACVSDDECTNGVNGQCELHWYWIDCHCTYDACESDADCKGASVCGCASEPEYGLSSATCLPSNCRTNADCSSGYCMGDRQPTCPYDGSITGWFCATPKDTCRSDEECGQHERCMFDAGVGYWACEGADVDCG